MLWTWTHTTGETEVEEQAQRSQPAGDQQERRWCAGRGTQDPGREDGQGEPEEDEPDG